MKRFLFCLSLIFGLSLIVKAQQNAAELEKKLKSANGNERFEILYDLSKYYLLESPKKSIEYGKKAIDQAKKLKNPDLQANANNLVGTGYYNSNNYRSALKYYEEELIIRKGLKQESSCIKIQYNIGTLYEASDRKTKAVEYYQLALDGAKHMKMETMVFQCYESLIRVYASGKEFEEAFKNLKAYMELKSISLPSDEVQKLAFLETKYLEEKQAKEKTEEVLKKKDSTISIIIDEKEQLESDTAIKGQAITNLKIETTEQKLTIEEQNEKVKRQHQWIMAFAGFILIVFTFSFLLFRQYRAKKRALDLLKVQHQEILEQKEEIQFLADKLIKSNNEVFEQNEEIKTQAEQLSIVNKEISKQRDEILFQKAQITDSIVYASRIQNVMLPSDESINEIFKDWMIFWRPQEIVSGDFYWIRKIKNFAIMAVADCTGHGVPGAFMSMLGISFLNELITKSRFDKTNEILEQLRKKIKKSLNQTGKSFEATDGMDMALCILDMETNILQYSGANNPLYLVRQGNIEVYKPDLQPIAIYPKEHEFAYHEIQLEKNDCIYLFSDGYIDQFGGEYGEKLKSSGFKKILLEISALPMRDQKVFFANFIDNWMGFRNKQTDDILIFGLRIS